MKRKTVRRMKSDRTITTKILKKPGEPIYLDEVVKHLEALQACYEAAGGVGKLIIQDMKFEEDEHEECNSAGAASNEPGTD
jgi:hypothetical protein